MRGNPQAQPDFLTVINLNQCVPADHPLRAIKTRADAVLQKLSPLFDELYAAGGRDSLPPEQLLKARVLTALYSVRSERLFCEQLGYNLLWLWFLDREFSEGSFDHSSFAKNYDRVLSADGTLIESWASLKSFVRKDGGDAAKVQSAKDEDPGNPTLNFRGERRRNDTHQSTTDAESVLYRKASGKEARLCFGAHALMENRNGLCADFTLHNPIEQGEPLVALAQMDAHPELHEGVNIQTVGADKGYHQKGFVQGCRARAIAPHVACKANVNVAGLDGRTTTRPGYQTSLKIRKRVEEIFGWIKTVGGFRRSRYRGLERTQAWGYFVAGTYNLLRLARLGEAA